jgi:DNA-binding NarL/FixJ family response regulator
VIDDDELIAHALSALCQRIPNIEVLGQATNGTDGLLLMERLVPQLALVDLLMPRFSGIDVLKAARQKRLRTRSIIVTGSGDQEWCARALRAGAAGYMLKGGAVAELRLAVHTVARGKKYVSEYFTDALDRSLVHLEDKTNLTPRHRQVLQLIVEGHSSKQIGDILKISLKTVEKHRAELMRRLRVKGTAELVKHALLHHLVVTRAS